MLRSHQIDLYPSEKSIEKFLCPVPKYVSIYIFNTIAMRYGVKKRVDGLRFQYVIWVSNRCVT